MCRSKRKAPLSVAELEIAQKIHNRVFNHLRTQYLWVALVVMIMAPILGLLVGALVENTLFTASRDRLFADAKDKIDEAVASAKDQIDEEMTSAKDQIDKEVANAEAAASNAEKRIRESSDKARGDLEEIRSTRYALDFVMQGIQTGEQALLQKRSKEVERVIKEFQKKLSKWEDALREEIPLGLKNLTASSRELKRLSDAVNQLDSLFESSDTAAALAGAFYRIDEFLGKFEVSLFVPSNVLLADLNKIVAAAPDVKAHIRFYRKGHGKNKQRVLQWVSLTPTIDIDVALKHAPRIGSEGLPALHLLRFRWNLLNDPSSWRISEKGKSSIKLINLLSYSEFDTISIGLDFPLSREAAWKALSSCTFSGNPYPRQLKLVSLVNRVEILMSHKNEGDEKIENPYPGWFKVDLGSPKKPAVLAAEGKAAEPEVYETPTRVSLVFSETTLFHSAAKTYTKQLAADGSTLLKKR